MKEKERRREEANKRYGEKMKKFEEEVQLRGHQCMIHLIEKEERRRRRNGKEEDPRVREAYGRY